MLDQIGQMSRAGEGEPDTKLPWTASGDAAPGLPGVRGWISGYVGPVTPQTDTWRENDGGRRGRYVLAGGTVVCTQRRAPTIDELMIPWKSLIVTMARICGREHPGPPDFSDPRVQPPPRKTLSGPGD